MQCRGLDLWQSTILHRRPGCAVVIHEAHHRRSTDVTASRRAPSITTHIWPQIPSELLHGSLRCAQEELKQPLQVIAQVQAAFAKALAAIAGVVGLLIGAFSATSGFVALQHRSQDAAVFAVICSWVALGLLRAWRNLHSVPAA